MRFIGIVLAILVFGGCASGTLTEATQPARETIEWPIQLLPAEQARKMPKPLKPKGLADKDFEEILDIVARVPNQRKSFIQYVHTGARNQVWVLLSNMKSLEFRKGEMWEIVKVGDWAY